MYRPVIGLEIHVELKTSSKMFCQCSADYFGKEPNSNTCPVCLGMPGALPVPNKKAVEWTIRIAHALHCTINTHTKFDRKHYFYPDLPKGYQISQYDQPIAINGYLDILLPPEKSDEKKQFRTKRFHIHRIHLEEDTGKLSHVGEDTLVDFNRSSVPLVEIVTEPDFDNSADVKAFLEEVHAIIRALDVSDADMEKGSMRMEPNISLMKITDAQTEMTLEEVMKQLPKYKVEVKNINSFNFAKKAIEYELKRQEELLVTGETPIQETRGYDEKKGTTYSQRSKENAQDYRYFPEPDIPPMEFSAQYLDILHQNLPQLPAERVKYYMEHHQIRYQDACTITQDKKIYTYVDQVLKEAKSHHSLSAQMLVNAIINKKISMDVSPDDFVQKTIEQIQPKQTDIVLLDAVAAQIISSQEKVVIDYKNGKTNALMFLVGMVMREMKGQANASLVKQVLEEKLRD